MSCNIILTLIEAWQVNNSEIDNYLYERVFAMRFVITFMACLCFLPMAHASEVNIYSHRQPFLLQPFLDAFTQKTGIQTNVVFAEKGLAQRLAAEGPASPADLVLTVDISRLSEYADLDLFQPVQSDVLTKAIPPHLRAPDNRWFGLSKRTRVIVVHKDRIAEGAISRIEDLADPKWKGRICTRKGSHVYNRALLAGLIAHLGSEGAQAWAEGLVANLARKPQGNDRAQAKAILSGECDIAIMNHYYYGKMINNEKEPAQKDWASVLRVILPNQADRGAPINITGGGIAKYAPHADNAKALLEYLVSDEAQDLYAAVNYEYSVTDDSKGPAGLPGFEALKADALPIQALADNALEAQMMIDRVGW